MYTVIDRASRNIMGEYATFVEAESCLLEFVGMNPPAAHDIQIVGPKGVKTVARDKVERAVQEHAIAALG
jgi:hypothetical protein